MRNNAQQVTRYHFKDCTLTGSTEAPDGTVTATFSYQSRTVGGTSQGNPNESGFGLNQVGPVVNL